VVRRAQMLDTVTSKAIAAPVGWLGGERLR
jgi:hypothetical protein